MLVWATEFPASTGTTAVDILPIAKRWLIGSPHFDWTEGDFGESVLGEIVTLNSGGETLRIGIAELDGQKWAGVQHSWTEKAEREWTTELVAYETDGEVSISVRLDCNLVAPGIELPKPNKPYLVKMLLEELGGGFDSLLPINDQPVRLREDEVDLAANLMLGRIRNQQPVVYASAAPRARRHKYAIRVGTLSGALAGMAHVIVEPSRHFSLALSRQVDGTNAYGGAVSVYWPNNAAQEVRFLPHRFDTTKQMEDAIVDVIRNALTHIRPKPEGTWGYLREAISRMRIEALKASDSTEVDEYIREFGVELELKEERIQGAEREIQRLKAVIRRLESSGGVTNGAMLMPGKEQEFYPGELRDALVATLRNGKATLVQDSRWMHLIDDILAANSTTPTQEEIEEGVKECLSAMSKFSASERKKLEDLGFEVDTSGKHAKAVYHGDDRYVFSISKTPSDHRSGKNMVSDINRKIFGA
jgi:hypothetical protein